MHAVFFDLEMNSRENGGAVIQIGAVTLSTATGVIHDHFSRLLKVPGLVLDPYITDLTGITREQLDGGVSPEQALADFWHYVGTKTLVCWGGDVEGIVAESHIWGVPVPQRLRAIDLKGMGAMMRAAIPGKSKGGLRATMETFGLEFRGRQHDALVDAMNTAVLARYWLGMIRAQIQAQETAGSLQALRTAP